MTPAIYCPVNVSKSSRPVNLSTRPVNVSKSSRPVNVSTHSVRVSKSFRPVNVSTSSANISKCSRPVNVSTRTVNPVKYSTCIDRKNVVKFFHLSALVWEFLLSVCIIANNVDTSTSRNTPLMDMHSYSQQFNLNFNDKFCYYNDVFNSFCFLEF